MMVLALAAILGTLPALVVRDVMAATTPTRGNVSASDPSDIDAVESERAPVTVDGEVLFQVRGIPAYPAKERAQTIRKRIEAIAADHSVAAESLRVVEMEDRTRIMAGDSLVAGFVDADAAAEGVSRQLIAERALMKIGAAIASYRNARSPRVLLFNTAYALGATVVLATVLLVIRGAFRRLDAVAERRLKSRIEALEAQSHQLVQARQLRTAVHGFLKGLYVLVMLVLGYVYLHLVLGLYPWTRPFAARLLAIFLDPLQTMGMRLLESLPGLAFVAVLVIVTRYALRLTRLYFESVDRGTVTLARFDREWALPTYKIARLLIIAFAAVVAYPYIPGSSSEAFKGVSIFLGVVFSLGSSSVISNLMAGYTMIYRRAFKVGDRISVNELTGDVTETRLMVTHLRTIKNEEIVVPNSTIINGHVINYSTLARTRGLILHTTVGIGYETPWRQVEAMLRLAAERTPGLLKEPAPFVLQKSLGDFAVTYELNAYCDDPHAMARHYTAMHQNILDIFNEHGVQIMTPAYEGDPETPKVVPKDQWYQAPAKPGQRAG
jgi:small-conductance mechanosensitive channel